jgi:hypothetical protein
VNPEGGKVGCAAAVRPLIEAGNVYLHHPLHAPWVNEFIEECPAFPTALMMIRAMRGRRRSYAGTWCPRKHSCTLWSLFESVQSKHRSGARVTLFRNQSPK